MSNPIWEVRECNCDYHFCLSLSSYVLEKSFSDKALQIFYIRNNSFSLIPQILNNFLIDFKPLDLRTWFAEQVYLSSMERISCPLKRLYFSINGVI